jgi:hypothetical protein
MSSAARFLAWSINPGSIPVAVLCLDILPNYRISEYHNSNFKKHLHTYSNIFSTLIIAPLSPSVSYKYEFYGKLRYYLYPKRKTIKRGYEASFPASASASTPTSTQPRGPR